MNDRSAMKINSELFRWAYDVHAISLSAFNLVSHGASQFNGDTDRFLICLACLLAAASDSLRAGKSGFLNERYELKCSVSVSSISAMTGIPRETVRRKMILLMDSGHVAIGQDGKYNASFDRSSVAGLISFHSL